MATDQITQNAIGTYEFKSEDTTATSIAVPCPDNAIECIQVTQHGEPDTPQWAGTAHWQVGFWIMFVQEPDALTCEDGTTYDHRVTYSWDAAANTGSRSYLYTELDLCGGDPTSFSTPFTLTKTAPPAATALT